MSTFNDIRICILKKNGLTKFTNKEAGEVNVEQMYNYKFVYNINKENIENTIV